MAEWEQRDRRGHLVRVRDGVPGRCVQCVPCAVCGSEHTVLVEGAGADRRGYCILHAEWDQAAQVWRPAPAKGAAA